MAVKELYARLGFDHNEPTEEEIKNRYRKLVVKCHPDKFPGQKDKEDQFKLITEAYEILSVAKRRKSYDETGKIHSGNEEDNILKHAILEIKTLVNNALDRLPESATNMTDLCETFKLLINQNIKAKRENIKEAESDIRKSEIVKKKLIKQSGDGSDIIGNLIDERIAEYKALLKFLNFAESVLNKMMEIVKNYKYDREIFGFNTNYSNNTSNSSQPFLIARMRAK